MPSLPLFLVLAAFVATVFYGFAPARCPGWVPLVLIEVALMVAWWTK